MIIQVSLQLLFHYCIINDQIGLSQLRWNLNIRQQSTTADQSTQTWLLRHLSPRYDGCSISAGTWNTQCMSILLGASGTFYISFLVHGTISLYEPWHPDNLSCPVLCEGWYSPDFFFQERLLFLLCSFCDSPSVHLGFMAWFDHWNSFNI